MLLPPTIYELLVDFAGTPFWSPTFVTTPGTLAPLPLIAGPLDGAGNLVIGADSAATDGYLLSWQGPQSAPTGTLYVSAQVPGVSFTVSSTAGAADAGKLAAVQRFIIG